MLDLEDVRDHVPGRIGGDGHALGVRARAAQEGRRIALGRVGHEALDDLQQLCNPRARLGRGKTHRYEMALAQGLLKRVVQLLRRELLALLQVQRHELLVELHYLVDDLGVRRLDRGEVGGAPVRLKETIHHAIAAAGGQVERQALGPERLAQLLEHLRTARFAAVDLVDDYQTAQLALACELHEALRQGIHAAHGTHHHGYRLHRLEHRQGLAEKVGVAGGVDDIDVHAAVIETADGGVEGVLQALLLRIEIGNRRAPLQAAARAGGPGLQQQRLQERGLARAGLPDEGDVADA